MRLQRVYLSIGIILVLVGLIFSFLREDQRDREAAFKSANKISDSILKSDQLPSSANSSSRGPTVSQGPPVSRNSGAINSTMPPLRLGEFLVEDSPLLSGTNWKILVGVTAIQKTEAVEDFKYIGEVARYLLKKSDFPLDYKKFNLENPMIVYNSRLNSAGVLTGVIRVLLKDEVNPDFFKSIPNLIVRHSLPDANTYFVTSSDQMFDLHQMLEELRREPAVREANLEILIGNYGKN